MFRYWRSWASLVVLATSTLPGCAPLPKTEYWGGYFRHLHPPRYTFQVPDGWRAATISDYPSLGFNRRLFQRLDEAGRRAAMQRAEVEMQGRDASLISSRGGWIQVQSAESAEGWYAGRDRFGLTDQQKKAMWQRLSTSMTQAAPPGEKPTLTLQSLDLVDDYFVRNVLRLRFTVDGPRGSMRWTVLEFYGSAGTVNVAHVGIPEDSEEGIAGLEGLASSFRFN
jgi:hypothetical protein